MGNRICKNLAVLAAGLLLHCIVGAVGIERQPVKTLQDQAKRSPTYSAFGETVAAERVPEFSIKFLYSIDPYDVTTVASGTGSLAVTNSMARMSTGASAGSSASIMSKDFLLYHAAFQSEFGFTAIFPTCTDGNTSLIGPHDPEGGIQIGCVNENFVIRHDDGFGNVTDYEQSTWNRDKMLSDDNKNFFVFDQTKLNIFRVHYAWYGTAPFVVECYQGANLGFRPIHVLDLPNTLTKPHMKNPSVPLHAYTTNTTNTTNIDFYTSSWAGINIGPSHDIGDRPQTLVASKTISAATESHIASIRVTTTFQGLHNHVPVRLRMVDAASDGNKPVVIRVYRNCASITGGAWAKINSDSSVVESNTTATSFSCSNLLRAFPLPKAGSDGVMFFNSGYRLNTGDTATITASSAQVSDVSATVAWVEQF